MRHLMILSIIYFSFTFSSMVVAQSFWIEVETYVNKEDAEGRVFKYNDTPHKIHGFHFKNGSYGLTLGPFTKQKAEQEIQKLLSNQKVPITATITNDSNFLSQFWPKQTLILKEILPEILSDKNKLSNSSTYSEDNAVIETSLEEVKKNEDNLTLSRKKYIQLALQNLDLYSSTIDGDFGKRTRTAMGSWQQRQKLPVTNILTSAQREVLLSNYEEYLKKIGFSHIIEAESGIQILLPILQKFQKYEAPFAYFSENTFGEKLKTILISLPGNPKTLNDFYRFLKKLQIIPQNSKGRLRTNYFTISGDDNGQNVFVYAHLDGEFIKGFLFKYPDDIKTDIEMAIYLAKNSIQGIETNILSAESPDTEEQLNLFSGLKIRTPKASQTGFFINRSGTILTSSKIVENCQKITLDMDIELDIVATGKGIAVLKPKTILSPLDYLKFSRSYTKLNSRVFASGFSYEGALGTPSMNTGTLVNTRGLKREKHLQQLLIQTEKGDYGAGVLSATGAVIGLLLHYDIENKEIPKSTAFSVKSSFIRKLLKRQRIEFDLNTEVTPLSVEKISKLAEDSSALISCW